MNYFKHAEAAVAQPVGRPELRSLNELTPKGSCIVQGIRTLDRQQELPDG